LCLERSERNGENYEITADNILSDFEKETKKYYGEEDRQRGYVYGKSRKGESDIFGLVSLTIAIATNRGDRYLDYNALMEALVRRKAKGKASKILKLYCN